jgi:rhodanese-related sulfurtransferase
MLVKRKSLNWFMGITVLIAGIMLSACGNAQQSSSGVIENVSPEVFENGVGNDKVLLLDVRTEKEVSQGHIEGATHIDFYGASFDQSLSTLNKEQEVYVYCRSGGRSYKTAEKLEALGFKKVYNLDGGIGAWQAADKKVVINE